MGTDFSAGLVAIRQGEQINTKRKRLRVDIWMKFFYSDSDETLNRFAQRGGGCSIPGNIQDHTGQGSKQPDLVEAVPLTGEGLYQVTFTSSFQPKPCYDSAFHI